MSGISFKMFEDNVPKTAQHFHDVNTEGEKFGYKVSAFSELFQDSCAKVETSYTTTALAMFLSTGRNLMMRTSS